MKVSDFLFVEFCLLSLALLAYRRKIQYPLWVVILVFTAFFLIPPFGSTDPFFYFGMAKQWLVNGANPYLGHFEKTIPFINTPFHHAMEHFVPYPPLWTILCGLLFRIGHEKLLTFVLELKLILLFFHIGNFMLIRKILPLLRPGLNLEYVAWIYLLHPLVLLDAISIMHYDVVWIFFVLLSLYCFLRNKYYNGFLFWGISFWIKYSAAFFLPVVVYFFLRKGSRNEVKIKWGVWFLATFISIGVFGFLFFKPPGVVISGFMNQARWVINTLFPMMLGMVGAEGLLFDILKLFLILIALCLPFIFRLPVRPINVLFAIALACGWLLAYLLVASNVFWPWYSLWVLIFSFFLERSKWEYIKDLAELFALLSFTYYPLLYLEGHVHASFDKRFQLFYALLSMGITLFVWAYFSFSGFVVSKKTNTELM